MSRAQWEQIQKDLADLQDYVRLMEQQADTANRELKILEGAADFWKTEAERLGYEE